MIVRFRCTQCGTNVKVDSEYAGRRAKCPGCQNELQIPSVEQIESAAEHHQPATASAPGLVPPAAPPPAQAAASENPYASPTTPYEPADYHAIRYGGFWVRVVAAVIDYFITGILGGLMGILMAAVGASINLDLAAVQVINFLLGTTIGWIYSAGLESSTAQGTVGKMAMGLKVVGPNGHQISFARATGRHFGKILSAMILYIGFIMVAFSERKQGLHDSLAGTYVVYK